MKFKDVKPGMVFKQEIGGSYGTKFWFVYKKTNGNFSAVLFFTRNQPDKRVKKVVISRDVFNDTDYNWRDNEPISVSNRYRKTLIQKLFKEM